MTVSTGASLVLLVVGCCELRLIHPHCLSTPSYSSCTVVGGISRSVGALVVRGAVGVVGVE